MRPSSLKQTISLTGCTLNETETKIRTIVINLSDGNMLCMEAASKEVAAEWVKVLKETMDILNSKSAAGKTRRINVANEHSDETDAVPKQVCHIINHFYYIIFQNQVLCSCRSFLKVTQQKPLF